MKNKHIRGSVVAIVAVVITFFAVNNAVAQYSTGYGTVYGSYGQAMATQNMYLHMQMTMRKTMARNAMIKRWGLAAVEKAEREAASGTKTKPSTGSPKIEVTAPPVVRNYGVFRPDATVDTGKALADALGESPAEKTLIKNIFAVTKAAYEAEAATRGWKNNIAAGLTFFTVTAMTVYRDGDEPNDAAIANYFKVVNSSLDEIPEFAKITNKDKQAYNNMLIGFSGILLAGYNEGKQNNDAATLASYKKIAGNLIEMVLKTDPENIRLENGQIVMK